MKIKKFLSLLLLALVALCLVACGGTDEPKENVQEVAQGYLDKVAITYASGDTKDSVTQNVTLGSCTVDGVTIEWTSDKAAINATGKVTRGDQDEKVTLTLKLTYKDVTLTRQFDVTVKAKEVEEVKPLNVKINGDTKMAIGSTYQLTAEVKPDDATDKSVTWSSDAEAIATVDKDGKVTAIAAGNATITATCVADNTVKGTLAIEVAAPTADTIAKTQAKAKGEEGWTKGTVVGVYARGFMLYDGTGYILVYMDKTEFTQKMGDYVEVKGTLGEYQGSKQFTATATLTALTEGTDYKLNATNADNAAVAALIETPVLGTKIKVRVNVTNASASYIDTKVKDGTAAISITYPSDSAFYEVGADYDVTGIVLYSKDNGGTKTLYLMPEKATKVDYGYDVSITYKDGESQEIVKINSLEFPLFELKEPTAKEGQVFLGWFKGTEAKPVKVTTILAPEDTTLFARWCATEDAPIVVNPDAEEGSGQYTSLAAALAAAKEGQTIELLAGNYTNEVLTLVERTYASWDAVVEAFMVDFNAVKSSSYTAEMIDTDKMDSGVFADIIGNADLRTKWAWLLKGMYEVAGYPENCDPETCTWTEGAVKQFYIANLNGLLTKTQHKDTWFGNTSYNWANENDVNKVFAYCDKKDVTQEDTTKEVLVINKKVTIIGPNMNVHGHDEERVDEAYITCELQITGEGVTINGVAFAEGGTIGIGANNITIDNCYIKPTKFVHYGGDNRMGTIANMINAVGTKILNTYICTPGTSYTNEAIAIDGTGLTDTTIDNCYFDTEATAYCDFEAIMAYRIYGQFIFTNNTCYFASQKGYFIRFGVYQTACTYVLIQDNIFSGVGDLTNATLGFAKMASNNAKYDVIHNQFLNVCPSQLSFGSAATTNVNVLYNYFDAAQSFKITNSCTMNFNYNYVAATKDEASNVDPATQANGFASLEELEAAYAIYAAELNRTATITFDVDGGDAIEAIVFKNAEQVVLPDATRAGYVFDGWYNGETKVTTISEKADITLKAKWIRINKITFDCDGGDAIETIEFTDFAKVTLPTPVKTGFSFAGWYEADTKVEAITENKDYALKATWSSAKVVTFEMDGGVQIDPITFEDYTKVVLPTKAKKAGFVFLGWYVGELKVEALTENADITLTAKWVAGSTVSFDVDGGDALEEIVFTDFATVVLPVATKNGMFFKAWTLEGTEVTALAENKDVTLKATYYTFEERVALLQENEVLVFPAGEFSSATITITVNGVTFKGVDYASDYAKDYVYDATKPHTVFKDIKLELAENVDGFTVDGITFTGKSHFVGLKKNTNVKFVNNILVDTGSVLTGDGTNDGVVYFANVAGIVIDNNVITGTTASPRIFRFKVVKDLHFGGNIFTDNFAGIASASGATDLLRVDTASGNKATGEVVFIDNIFQNASQAALHIRPIADANLTISNNYFNEVNAVLWLRDFTGDVNVSFVHNYLGQGLGKVTFDVIGANAGYKQAIIAYNYFAQTTAPNAGESLSTIWFNGANNIVHDNYFAITPTIKLNKLAVTDTTTLADGKAVAFLGASEFDAWACGGVEDFYYTTLEAASNDANLPENTKLVVLYGEHKGGKLSKQLTVTSYMEGFKAADNKAAFKALAPKIVGQFVFNKVLSPSISNVAITGKGQIITLVGPQEANPFTQNTVLNNLYAYDSTIEATAYASNGIIGTGSSATTTRIAVIQLQGVYCWIKGGALSDCVFENINCGAFFGVCGAGFNFTNNEFKNVAYDAITFRYTGGTGDAYVFENNKFENIGANAIYIRSATGTYTNDLVVKISDCTFTNVAYDRAKYQYDATTNAEADKNLNYGCIVTRGYGEKKNATFEITHCVFNKSAGYICIRDNVTGTDAWVTKNPTLDYKVTVKYCTFEMSSDTQNISESYALAAGDSAATNLGHFLFDNNYYYYMSADETPVATAAHPTYDQKLEATDTTVYATAAELATAWNVYYASTHSVELTLSEAELAIINEYKPTILVKADFTNAAYKINDLTFYPDQVFTSLDDALAAAKAGDVIYVFAGAYTVTKDIAVNAITVVGPNANVTGNATRVDEAVLTVTPAALQVKGTWKFVGVKITSSNSASGDDIFTETADTVKLELVNNYICNIKNFAYGKGTGTFVFDGCYFDGNTQYIAWFDSAKETIVKNCDFNMDTCGTVGSESYKTSLFRIRGGDFTFVNNYVESEPDWYLCEVKTGNALIAYNTFKNNAIKVYVSATGNIVANNNLYLNAEGVALTASTLVVTKAETATGTFTADTNVYASEADRKAAYEAYAIKGAVAAIAAAYMADFNAKNGSTEYTIDSLSTAIIDSPLMAAMLTDAELLAKWSWLYKALMVEAGKEAMYPDATGFDANTVKFVYLANLYGFFHGEAHADQYSQSTMSPDYSNAEIVARVLAANPAK